MMHFTAKALFHRRIAPVDLFRWSARCVVEQAGAATVSQADFSLQDGPVYDYPSIQPGCTNANFERGREGAMTQKPKLAVWKFASCDGCQLSLLDCEDGFARGRGRGGYPHSPEATRRMVVWALRCIAGGGIDHHAA